MYFIVLNDEDCLDAIRRAGIAAEEANSDNTRGHIRAHAANAALATGIEGDEATDSLDVLAERYGPLPDWWKIPLLPYQRLGAYAVVARHHLNADTPGLGKTYQSLAAAAPLDATRVLS